MVHNMAYFVFVLVGSLLIYLTFKGKIASFAPYSYIGYPIVAIAILDRILKVPPLLIYVLIYAYGLICIFVILRATKGKWQDLPVIRSGSSDTSQ